MTNQNDALAKAVHDLAVTRPDTVRGRIVFILDDIDDEKLHRATESSGVVDTKFLTNFVSSVTEYFATVMKEGGVSPSTAGTLLRNAADSGVIAAFCGGSAETDAE